MLAKDEEDKLISELTFNNEDSIECDIHKIIDTSIKVGYPYSNYFLHKFDTIIADKLAICNKYPKPTQLLDENNQPVKKYDGTEYFVDTLPEFVNCILLAYYRHLCDPPMDNTLFLPNLNKYIHCNVLSYKIKYDNIYLKDIEKYIAIQIQSTPNGKCKIIEYNVYDFEIINNIEVLNEVIKKYSYAILKCSMHFTGHGYKHIKCNKLDIKTFKKYSEDFKLIMLVFQINIIGKSTKFIDKLNPYNWFLSNNA